MVKNAREARKEIEEYLEDLINNYLYTEDVYYEGFNYGFIKENLDTVIDKYIVFIDENGKVTNIAHYEKQQGFDYFLLDDLVDEEIINNNLSDIKKNYERPIISFVNEYIDYSKLTNLHEINLNSKVAIDEHYIINFPLFCVNEKDKDLIVDLADKLNFPKFNNKLTFEILDEEKIYDLQDYDDIIPVMTKNESNHTHFAGFHYFVPECMHKNNVLVAKDGDNIVGALKFGEYGKSDFCPHMAVCYIDVKKPYRNKGIATSLFKEFGRIMEEAHKKGKMDLPIFLTSESEMGEKCHMMKIALENIKNLVVYHEDRDKYEYVLYFNNEELDRNISIKKLIETYNDKIVYKPPTLEDLIDQGLSLKEISSIIKNNEER